MGIPVKPAHQSVGHLIEGRQPLLTTQPVAVEGCLFPGDFGHWLVVHIQRLALDSGGAVFLPATELQIADFCKAQIEGTLEPHFAFSFVGAAAWLAAGCTQTKGLLGAE